MRAYIEKPKMVAEAAARQKGLPFALEILLFLGVFILGFFAEMVFILPGEMFFMYTDKEYAAAALSGDAEAVLEASNRIASSNGYMILSLIATLGLIFATWFSCHFFQKRKLSSLGFTKAGAWKEYLRGALCGFVVFSAAVLICVATGALKFEGFSSNFSIGIFLAYLVGFLIQGMSEEMLCRGYFMVSVARRYSMLTAILTNSVVFAMLHLLNSGISALAFLNLTLYGIFASLYFIKRGNIWAPAAFHSVWNLVQGNVYGVLVSGTTNNCKLLNSLSVEGKELLNGGAFGLEGGLGVTIVMVAGIVFLATRGAAPGAKKDQGQQPAEEEQAAPLA